MAVYVKTVLDYHDAMNQYSQWVLQDKLVFAVDIKHECPEYSEFLRLIVNVDPIFKVILFNQNSFMQLGSCALCIPRRWDPF